MIEARVSLVDVHVLRLGRAGLECLVLRRAPGGRSPGSWEVVHGHIEGDEAPTAAAVRELAEETGLVAERLYNLSRVEAFYLHAAGDLALIPGFAAIVPPDAPVRLSVEHDAFRWLDLGAAKAAVAWPRERRALDDVAALLADGSAGPVEDVLRIF